MKIGGQKRERRLDLYHAQDNQAHGRQHISYHQRDDRSERLNQLANFSLPKRLFLVRDGTHLKQFYRYS